MITDAEPGTTGSIDGLHPHRGTSVVSGTGRAGGRRRNLAVEALTGNPPRPPSEAGRVRVDTVVRLEVERHAEASEARVGDLRDATPILHFGHGRRSRV